jgi:hypothetical protein
MSTLPAVTTVKPPVRFRNSIRKAKIERKTVSEVVREILEGALVDRPLAERLGKTRGSLRIAEARGGWQRQIRERNSRP